LTFATHIHYSYQQMVKPTQSPTTPQIKPIDRKPPAKSTASSQPVSKAATSQVKSVARSLVHPLDQATDSRKPLPVKSLGTIILVAVLVIAAGAATGYALADKTGRTTTGQGSGSANGKSLFGSKSAEDQNGEGVNDDQMFPDIVDKGVLQPNDGSITMEGTHMLLREGGPSQTVFLTSSVVDLSQYEGQQVTLRGRTFNGETAGWIMDVGWIKVLE
jgi:hypothetical protein